MSPADENTDTEQDFVYRSIYYLRCPHCRIENPLRIYIITVNRKETRLVGFDCSNCKQEIRRPKSEWVTHCKHFLLQESQQAALLWKDNENDA